MKPNPTVVLSRTDRIGDLVLTLPMAGVLKKRMPGCRVVLLVQEYTAPIAAVSEHVDEVIDYGEWERLGEDESLARLEALGADAFVHVFPRPDVARLAHRAKIPLRIGTVRKAFHWLTCNRRLNFTRRGSHLHEAQLNLKLLAPLGVDTDVPREELPGHYGFTRIEPLPEELAALTRTGKTNLVLHPLSQGSAVEWGLDNFAALIRRLDPDRYHVFVTGTSADGSSVRDGLPLEGDGVTDLTGRLTLPQLVSFIDACDAMVAASTGPLHIAAALGKRTVGLYSSRRPIHPGRWGPLGANAVALTHNGAAPGDGDRIESITPEEVVRALEPVRA